MEPPLYKQSVTDRNIVMRRMTVHVKFTHVAVSCITQPGCHTQHSGHGLGTPDVDCHTTQATQHHKPEGCDLHL